LNKNGIIVLADINFIILTVLLLVAYIILLVQFDIANFGDKNQIIELDDGLKSSENEYLVLNYLNTEVNEFTFADMIYSWKNGGSVVWSEIESETEILFSKVYGNCYEFEIDGNNINAVIFNSDSASCIDFSVDLNEVVEICIDISEYDNKFENYKEEECFV
jgi:hypothetical protein